MCCLRSTCIPCGLVHVWTFVNDFIKTNLDNFLHRNQEVAQAIEKRIKQSERERKEIAAIKNQGVSVGVGLNSENEQELRTTNNKITYVVTSDVTRST